MSTERVPQLGYGTIELESPEESEGGIGNTFECVNVGLGTAYNATEIERNPSGKNGYGSILVWWASGHAPGEVHKELSAHCRFAHHGENHMTERAAWATAEPRLQEPKLEAEVCTNKAKKLSECTAATERETELLITEVKRESLTLPWEAELISSEGKSRTKIGVPSAEERAKGHTTCETFPVPAGCIKVQILVPELAVDDPFEGFSLPLNTNGVKNGLSPSTWSFEGRGHEPCLRFALNTERCGFTKGIVKILGYNNQELVTQR
jgi:hypothetical protein